MNIIKLKKRPLQGLAGLAMAAMLAQIFALTPAVFAAAGGAEISASVTPTTVESGSTEEFDISVSNGASATSNIDVITVSRTLDFVIDENSIQCPFAWTLNSSSPDSFTCAAGTTIFGSADIDPGNTGHIIFMATAPEVTATTSTLWNMYYQDHEGGEYEGPEAHFTVVPSSDETTPPPTATSTGAVISASVLPTNDCNGFRCRRHG